ncbi:hypothetical protein CAEBREN_21859 [Caenorhabditis brenneri]|uniref:Sdz-33 F-box domain-containing protein n=1 Tax=Caenorhabditis brenneri TaxID=135651 RepID=G0NPH8_CAEBE|nr:hypothetical protein CAEBREN_21859 [Caenorhabditis brenneri]
MPVPILKLPFLALKVVIACGEDSELLAISLGSRRADRAVKACGRTPSFLDYEFRRENCFTNSDNFTLNIHCISEIDQYKGSKKYLMIDGTCVPTIFSDNQVCTFWNERVNGLQFFVKYFGTKFFIDRSFWNFDSAVPDFRRLMHYLISMQNYSIEDSTRVRKISVDRNAKLSHSDYSYLLSTVTADLDSDMETSDDFKFTGKLLTGHWLKLTSAHWFTLEHLLKCKCQYVQVEGSKLSNKQFKVFIRRWMTGRLSHFIQIELLELTEQEQEVDLDFILRGIKAKLWIGRASYSRGHRPPPRKIIKAKTGPEARIQGSGNQFRLNWHRS